MASSRGTWAVTTLALMGASFMGGVFLTPHLATRDSTGTPVSRLAVGDSRDGELSSASPINLKDGSRYQHLKVDVAGPGVVNLSLKAPFAGGLTVLDESNAVLARTPMVEADGSGAQASFRAPHQGSYTLIVSGADHRAFGPFTVSARQIDLDERDVLSGTGELRGWLEGGSATHTLEITELARYAIALSSDSFDTVLDLTGNGVSRHDDDGGDGTNSLIRSVLSPGTYSLRVQAFGAGSADGLYTLAVTSEPAPDMDRMLNEGPLPLDGPVTGWLQPGAPNTYTLQVDTAGRHTLEVSSVDFDTVLELEGQGLALEDDDGGNDTDSRLQAELPAGSYQVRVRAFGDEGSGTYTLNVRRGD